MRAKPQFLESNHFKSFWQKGNGKELLESSGWIPNLQNFDYFSHLSFEVDQLADAVVMETYKKMPYTKATKMIEQAMKTPMQNDSNYPKALKELLYQMQQVPDWYDQDLANIGARLNMRSGTNALMVLRDFSLMGGYDFSYLNKALIFTGALQQTAVKRLKNTLEFWVNVTRTDGLKLFSPAFENIVKTRLMHAWSRISIDEHFSATWDTENWGKPINHWDMIATYLGFSLVLMQGLKKLGIKISEEEEIGTYHLWKYIGYLLGLPIEFLAESQTNAVESFYLWTTTQAVGDQDSVQLAKALLDESLSNNIYKYNFQRKILYDLHAAMSGYLIDEEVKNRLELPKPKIFSFFPKFIIATNRISQNLINITHPAKYQKLVNIGHKQQMKVLNDYINHS
ncbi:MAG: oxygenase MpaB family protein [Flavobacteriaceae bacterium]|nr:oxygenase MpaB family protein [Flavobacteriaceae bacterium]